MCGIAGIHLRNPDAPIDVNQAAMNLLLGIEHRGRDATGYAAQTASGQVVAVRAAAPAKEFIKEAPRVPEGTRSIILHTRFATQGHQGFMENNHPIECGDTYVVHNGHIYNDDEVIKIAGFERRGRVDSEAIPQIIEHYGWDKAAKSLEELYGAYAVAALNRTRPGEVLLAKGPSSPLFVYVSAGLVMWASTRYSIETAWKFSIGTFNPKKVQEVKEGQYLILRDESIELGTFDPLWYEAPKKASWDNYSNTTTKASTSAHTPLYRMETSESWEDYLTRKYGDGEVTRQGSEGRWDSPYSWDDEEVEWEDDMPAIKTASGYQLSPKLQRALDAMGERARRRHEQDEDGTPIVTIAPTRVQVDSEGIYWIACANCLELTEIDEMEGDNDLYCWSCWTHLHEDEKGVKDAQRS